MPRFVKYYISLFDFSFLSPLMPGGKKGQTMAIHTYKKLQLQVC